MWGGICMISLSSGLFYYIVWLSGEFGPKVDKTTKDSRVAIVIQAFVAIVATSTTITFIRMALLVVGHTLYLSQRQFINGRYSVSDSFFLALRLSLQKLSILLYLLIYLPVLKIFLDIIQRYRTSHSDHCTWYPWSCFDAFQVSGLFVLTSES
jgi:hypothetical protein